MSSCISNSSLFIEFVGTLPLVRKSPLNDVTKHFLLPNFLSIITTTRRNHRINVEKKNERKEGRKEQRMDFLIFTKIPIETILGTVPTY